MPQITAKVMYVNPAEAGKRYGSIKTDDLSVKRISVPQDKLYLFQRGSIYTIEYKVTDAGYYNFVSIVSEQKATPVPMAPRAGERPPAGRSGSVTDKDPKAIFVTGVVGRAMGSGKFVADDISMLTQWAAHAFDKVLGPTPKLPLTAPAPRPSPHNGRAGTEPAGPRDDVPYVGEELNDDPWGEDDDTNPPF